MNNLAYKPPTMADGKEYIVVEIYNDDGSVSEKMIGLQEAAEILNQLSNLYREAALDLDKALAEVEFWKDMYSGYFSTPN